MEYWSRLPFPPPGDLPNLGIEFASLCLLHWQAGSISLAPPGNSIESKWTWAHRKGGAESVACPMMPWDWASLSGEEFSLCDPVCEANSI